VHPEQENEYANACSDIDSSAGVFLFLYMNDMKKNQKKIIVVLGIVIVVIALFFVYTKNKKEVASVKNISIVSPVEVTKNPEEKKIFVKKDTQNIVATVVAGDTTLHLTMSKGETLYDALMNAKNNNQLIFSGKAYPSLGFFVTDIGSLHAGSGKNLFYYVNGKEADVGISSYVPTNGDVVDWKLE